ncbi:hypothetical protein NKR23_g5526 [Pleurostoma richardsiae]|uniref:Uncharacterized protein n=1 Tax=Pleurostoma richardsiae TaxID=41990 RepID=A0AA38S1K4_9PEZI|nr:hypothetical protein NKR23_g5526 [Pleurostoma richardsiae]
MVDQAQYIVHRYFAGHHTRLGCWRLEGRYNRSEAMQLQESYQKAAFEGSECPQTGPGSPKYRDFGDMRNWDVCGEMKKVGGEHELAIDSNR